MQKGYWLARLTVTDSSAYGEYRRRNEAIYAKFGARFVVRGGKSEAEQLDPGANTMSLSSSGVTMRRSRAFTRRNTRKLRNSSEKGSEVDIVICEEYGGA